jgi:hypothetical protein
MYYSKNNYRPHLACPRLRLCRSVAKLNTECAAILRAKEYCAAVEGIRAPLLYACSMHGSKTVDCWNDKDLEGRVCGIISVLYQNMPGRSEGNQVKPQLVWWISRPTFGPCYFQSRSTVLLLCNPLGPHSTDPDITTLLKHDRLYLHENMFQYISLHIQKGFGRHEYKISLPSNCVFLVTLLTETVIIAIHFVRSSGR